MSDAAPLPLPEARWRPRRQWSWLWLLPVAAVAAAGGLLLSAWYQRGLPVTVEFRQGHGLKAGDAVRYRGIAVGTVQEVALAPDLNGIRVHIRLGRQARDLARAESRFWIVRPELTLSGAQGLDTVLGANYVGVQPGPGAFQDHFSGLEEPPLPGLEPGGLEVVVTTSGKGALRPGAAVSYRQVDIGTVLGVDLAGDASAVEARLYIRPAYTGLIREHTRFWKTEGARFSAGLTGLSVAVESVQSLLLGGVALAVPPNPGEPAVRGQRFTLYEKPESDWLEWSPSLALDRNAPAINQPQPQPQPRLALAGWQYKNLFRLTRAAQRRAWVLPIRGGLLGPADVLRDPADALPGSRHLMLDGKPVVAPGAAQPYSQGLAILPYEHGYEPWSAIRFAEQPEDALVIADPAKPARFIGANRYRLQDSDWRVDPDLEFAADWHGACLVAKRDGALIGILLVGDDRVEVARLPEPVVMAHGRGGQ